LFKWLGPRQRVRVHPVAERLVHVLFGSSGDYEEYRRWPIRVYERREDADAARDRLEKLATRLDQEASLYRQQESEGTITWDRYDELTKKLAAQLRALDHGDSEYWGDVPKYDVEQLAFVPALRRRQSPKENTRG